VNKNILIGAAIVIALILALPLAAKLKQGGAGSDAGTPAPTSEPAGPTRAGQAPYWNAGNLPGTSWVVSGYTVNLQPGGVASASTPFGQITGSWAVNGSTLNVKAAGQEINAQISGDQILVDGTPAQRAQ
jgi:hypothetical protein